MKQSKPRRIIAKIESRLRQISKARGFCTASLKNVYLGREQLYGEDIQFPCASILQGEETVVERKDHLYRVTLPITIIGLSQSKPNAPLDAGHELLADIQRALFSDKFITDSDSDRLDSECISFEYEGSQIIPREDGGNTTGVIVNASAFYRLDANELPQ